VSQHAYGDVARSRARHQALIRHVLAMACAALRPRAALSLPAPPGPRLTVTATVKAISRTARPLGCRSRPMVYMLGIPCIRLTCRSQTFSILECSCHDAVQRNTRSTRRHRSATTRLFHGASGAACRACLTASALPCPHGRLGARRSRHLSRLRDYPLPEREDLIVLSLMSHDRSCQPQAVFSRETALALHDLGDMHPARIHLTVPRGLRRQLPPETVIHRGLVPQRSARSATATVSPRRCAA